MNVFSRLNIHRLPAPAKQPAARPIWPLALLALLAGLLFVSLPAQAQNSPAQSQPFIVGVDSDISTYLVQWTWLIYAEAFRRMGIPLKFNSYPLQRLSAMVDEGAIDGEGGRVYGYGATHPNLVRVEESLLELNFSLYTAHPTLRLQRKDEQAFTGLRVEYRRGILMCETTLKRWVAPERLSDVTTVEQGVNKLLARRTDLYCDLDIHILTALHTPEFKGATSVRKVLDLSTSVPIYPYLHKKHAALAPRLAATLKAMKAEGLIEAYRLQTERERGWRR